jgi:hypothetical protein
MLHRGPPQYIRVRKYWSIGSLNHLRSQRAFNPGGSAGFNLHRPTLLTSTQVNGFMPNAPHQGLTLVHFSAQPRSFLSHLPVSPCLIDWGTIMHPTYPTKCAYVAPNSGRVLAPAHAPHCAVGIQSCTEGQAVCPTGLIKPTFRTWISISCMGISSTIFDRAPRYGSNHNFYPISKFLR